VDGNRRRRQYDGTLLQILLGEYSPSDTWYVGLLSFFQLVVQTGYLIILGIEQSSRVITAIKVVVIALHCEFFSWLNVSNGPEHGLMMVGEGSRRWILGAMDATIVKRQTIHPFQVEVVASARSDRGQSRREEEQIAVDF